MAYCFGGRLSWGTLSGWHFVSGRIVSSGILSLVADNGGGILPGHIFPGRVDPGRIVLGHHVPPPSL